MDVLVRRRLRDDRRQRSIAHELSEYATQHVFGYQGPGIEEICNDLTLRIVAPDLWTRAAFSRFRFCYVRLALFLGLTSTQAAIRVAQACDLPTAIVGPTETILVGEWTMSDRMEMHEFAHLGSCPRQIERVELPDAPGHVALVMAR
jgi:hypothetical protein